MISRWHKAETWLEVAADDQSSAQQVYLTNFMWYMLLELNRPDRRWTTTLKPVVLHSTECFARTWVHVLCWPRSCPVWVFACDNNFLIKIKDLTKAASHRWPLWFVIILLIVNKSKYKFLFNYKILLLDQVVAKSDSWSGSVVFDFPFTIT